MFVGIIKNFKVNYRTKILKAILTQIHHVSSAYDLSKKLTVLDAIMWTKAAVKEIKITTVTNCFKSCGFPIPKTDETSSTSESTTSEELTELVNFLSPNCKENYADIDAELETESSSIDILDFIPTERMGKIVPPPKKKCVFFKSAKTVFTVLKDRSFFCNLSEKFRLYRYTFYRLLYIDYSTR